MAQGTFISNTMMVMRMAITPSLNASADSFPCSMCSRSKELPLDTDGHRGWQREDGGVTAVVLASMKLWKSVGWHHRNTSGGLPPRNSMECVKFDEGELRAVLIRRQPIAGLLFHDGAAASAECVMSAPAAMPLDLAELLPNTIEDRSGFQISRNDV